MEIRSGVILRLAMDIDTSMQKGHNWKTYCCKVITEEPSAVK